MARSDQFRHLLEILRIADYCEAKKIPSREGLERVNSLKARERSRRMSRREFLRATGRIAAAGALTSVAWPKIAARAAAKPAVNIAIVGAGLAGLACADELQRSGITATIYDANDRIGGRCFSLGGFFPGQVAERGGEFIDNAHKTMLGYARRFGLTLEDVEKEPGEVFYFFNGQRYSESAVVDEFRAFVPALRDDLRRIAEPTAAEHTAAEAALDFTDLGAYLESRRAGTIAKKAIEQAYIAEYGLEIDRQSCLSLLLFIHADRRSKFRPFGNSDERYHVIEGNDRIAAGLAAGLRGAIHLGRKLVKARKTAGGDVELTFQDGATTVSVTHDAVVMALPFSTLREVALDTSLGFPAWKLQAINELRYGTNAKMMVGFSGRPWAALGSRGASYSDLPNHQATWETNPAGANSLRAVLTDYSGGERGASLNPNQVQIEAALFLADLERVYAGALAAATRDGQGNFHAHLEHWPSNPLTKGSYTCNHPGYFTTIADNEAPPIGNVYFAGEHTSSFYEWQGFMEGAALSGIRAAKEILRDIKRGALR